MRRATLLLIGLGSILAAWLFIGVYRDREFCDLHLFVKDRPTSKIYFFAPAGEADTLLGKLSPNERKEEEAYRTFIEQGRGYDRSLRL